MLSFAKTYLPAETETVDEAGGKAKLLHPLLQLGDGIGDAVVFEGEVIQIENCVAGARIAVTRLPHAAGAESDYFHETGLPFLD